MDINKEVQKVCNDFNECDGCPVNSVLCEMYGKDESSSYDCGEWAEGNPIVAKAVLAKYAWDKAVGTAEDEDWDDPSIYIALQEAKEKADKANDAKIESAKEAVVHPKHYNRDGGMECIDEMLMVFGKRAVMDFALLSSWKYRYRAADKNGLEDLKKSDYYMNLYKQLMEGICHENR